MANNIKHILKEKGMSIYKLSQEIGLTYPNAHALVNRKSLDTTSLDTIIKVAEALDVEIEQLYK